MTCLVEEWLQLKGLESLRGRGALELNTEHCYETQRELHERDRLHTQHEQKKKSTNELWYKHLH